MSDHMPNRAVRRMRKVSIVLLAGISLMLALGPAMVAPDYAPTRAALDTDPPPVAERPAVQSTVPAALSRVSIPPQKALAAKPVAVRMPVDVAVAPEELWPMRPLGAVMPPSVSPESGRDATASAEPRERSKPKPSTKPAGSQDKAKASEPNAKSEPKAKTEPKSEPKPEPGTQTYSGKQRLWYPALGIDARWKWYGCKYGETSYGLDGGVYQWGCAGAKNVYLMSHAWSTFKAIRKGYHSGAMKVGQSVWYADPKGNVTKWKVKWMKRVKVDYFLDTFYLWASNASDTPIMTFQTCDGSRDQYRIIVRLVPAR